ncbi:MAG TPA: S8 family peptidase [Anaerolineae bacterium]
MSRSKRPLSFVPLLLICLLLASLPAAAAPAGPDAVTQPGKAGNHIYLVQMADPPAVSYAGGIAGLKATKPSRGQKIDPLSADVVAYAGYLDGKHTQAVNAAGGRKVYDYHYSYNGFAAELTEAQAAGMQTLDGVLAVSADEIHYVDTSTTPTFLGLDAPNGLWDQLGGTGSAGDGVIIGVIDSGIWPESLSFSDRTGVNGNDTQEGKLSYQQIPGWHGKCTPGEAWNASMCNQKLIGAQWFNASWGGDAGVKAQRPWEFASARDYNGHGTHTSSTAGGNPAVPVTGPAAAFKTINGIAPHARVAMYKALWSTQAADTASGSTSDLVAAIDQAVADGVDVINYSISGTLTNFRDPAEIAFLYAADAGIFVAASAGNSGPTTSTVAHPSPWITTVAAGTHNRSANGTVTLGNNAVYTGASVSPAAVTAPLIDSTAAGLPGADSSALALCFSAAQNGGTPVLDPAKVKGKIVVCDRGVSARVDKSLAVLEAGGVGMILVNTNANSLNADFHSVPTVHLAYTDRPAVKAYAATPGATATISKAMLNLNTPAPFTAAFSSRGPLKASADLLKPDLIAPGQDILAAVSPAAGGRMFDLYSGTSMSSPHVAGLAALLKDRHPDWTPMMIKSALMTTAYDVLDGPNTNPLVIFRQGAGHVKPNDAADPGLVFNSGLVDWFGFLCGTQLSAGFCKQYGIPVLDPSDFNVASVAIAELAGSQTVVRTVTNVGPKATYNLAVTGLSGIKIEVTPASFTLNPGQSQTLAIKFTRTTAALNAYTGGYLTWSDGTHRVRIPAVVKPVALAAPAQVSGSYQVTFGYDGLFTATPRGLVAAQTFDGSIMTDPTGTFKPVESPSTLKYEVAMPAGTTYARFSLFDANVSPASDLDLYVYKGTSLVGSSGGGTTAEEVNLVDPAAGTYTVWVHGFETGNPTKFTLFAWVLDAANAGNMTVTAPAKATLGGTGEIQLDFTGLAAGTKYLGSVVYGGADGMPSPTIVRLDR